MSVFVGAHPVSEIPLSTSAASEQVARQASGVGRIVNRHQVARQRSDVGRIANRHARAGGITKGNDSLLPLLTTSRSIKQ
mgnify:CR=1 FL=1